MRVTDRPQWERPYPVRFLIVGESEDDDAIDVDLLLGRCAAAEGLFADPPPPPREVLVLRGCAPGLAAGRLGPAVLVGLSESGREYSWELLDAEVLVVGPHSADPTLVDVVVGAAVGEVDDFRLAQDPCERFELPVGRDEPPTTCTEVTGLPVAPAEPTRLPVRLIGCEPTEPLRAKLDGGYLGWPAYTQLWALDDTGRVMARLHTGLAVDRVRPSVLGGGLLDLLLSVPPGDLPGSAGREAWQRWQQGPPEEPGSWRGLSVAAKKEWQSLALYRRDPGPDRPGGEYHLAGAGVEDETGLHCALGEAVNGPGGYYGREWNGFKDCFGGGFGPVPPFTLVWHDFAATERELAARAGGKPGAGGAGQDGRSGYPEELARLMESRGIRVVRA
ncbi:barstar family protein [Kitasatospora sp. NPDC059795]|uniref:barstar family protein n=1 Tax=Kitasatospora sp. NPDC059795 TaxID=3346949 RepID=UPI00365BC32B